MSARHRLSQRLAPAEASEGAKKGRDTTPRSERASEAKFDTQCVSIVVPGHPLGANQVGGRHWGTRNRDRLDWQNAAYWAWVEAGRPRFPRGAVVSITCVFGTPGRRDASNYAGAGSVKWILDALTNAEVWPDDSQRWLDLAAVETVYRRGEWAVVLLISERSTP